jgi:transposase-like protein
VRQPGRRRGGFQPPHCPNPQCSFHRPNPDWRFVRNGHHIRHSDGRRIQDFRCRHCGRRFSTPTFSTTYWLRRPQLLLPIATLVSEGAALRQAARALRTSHATVMRHLIRLGRHALLFHQLALQGVTLAEPLVVDGFESFTLSQFFPFHANLAVGADSWFLYHFTHAPLRRKGAMTPGQQRKRAELERRFGRPDPKAVERSMADLIRPLLARLAGDTLELHSDDHPAYRRALHRLRREMPHGPRIVHRITPSTVRRTQSNPLFPVNLADLLLRHGSANHRRETIAFSKCLQAALERLAVFLIWRDYIKKRREKESAPAETAAMRAGVWVTPLTWRQVLRRRLFPKHVGLPETWEAYYWREVTSPPHRTGLAPRRVRYAF